MKSADSAEEKLKKAKIGTFFRPRHIASFGISFQELQRLVKLGKIEKISKGLYRLSSVKLTELETVAMVCSAVPSGIVCLLSALSIYDIGTQNPHEVWLALDIKARKPAHIPAQVRFFRFSGAMLTYGVQTRMIQGISAHITSPARTVVDCFRYRNKIGIDVAIEALRDAVRSRKVMVDEIVRAAEVCRARTIMHPYLETLAP
jgi:predicted transcriptional regulator of viral defense system